MEDLQVPKQGGTGSHSPMAKQGKKSVLLLPAEVIQLSPLVAYQ